MCNILHPRLSYSHMIQIGFQALNLILMFKPSRRMSPASDEYNHNTQILDNDQTCKLVRTNEIKKNFFFKSLEFFFFLK